jgi:hypothetical protein
MEKVLRGLTVPLLLSTLLLWSQPSKCAAQGRSRAPRAAEDPLAATLRLAGGLESGLTKETMLLRLVRAHVDAGRLEEAVRAASSMDDGGLKALMLSRLANAFAEADSLDRAAELLAESLLTMRRAEDEYPPRVSCARSWAGRCA